MDDLNIPLIIVPSLLSVGFYIIGRVHGSWKISKVREEMLYERDDLKRTVHNLETFISNVARALDPLGLRPSPPTKIPDSFNTWQYIDVTDLEEWCTRYVETKDEIKWRDELIHQYRQLLRNQTKEVTALLHKDSLKEGTSE